MTSTLPYTLLVFGLLMYMFTLPVSPLSIFQWDEPITQIGGASFTRGDLYDSLKILSLASFTAGFLLLTTGHLKLIRRK